MATTYLILSNRVLRELNEVEMTSSNFSSSRGIQTAVKDLLNKSIHDIYNEGAELRIKQLLIKYEHSVQDNTKQE